MELTKKFLGFEVSTKLIKVNEFDSNCLCYCEEECQYYKVNYDLLDYLGYYNGLSIFDVLDLNELLNKAIFDNDNYWLKYEDICELIISSDKFNAMYESIKHTNIEAFKLITKILKAKDKNIVHYEGIITLVEQNYI